MNDSKKIKTRFAGLGRAVWGVMAVWTLVVAVSLTWNIVVTRQETLEAARIQARVAYEKDIIYRRWNTGHGGVYVPVTKGTESNPYLSDIPERDITTPSGELLTLMNPAYMTRQVYELAEEEYGVRGHITSLDPIRPQNAADPWETKALRAFESEETEISSVEEMEGKEYMRLMRPLITEKGCLRCHAAYGSQEGDIRGGISVSIPMEPLWAIGHRRTLGLLLGHGLLWLMGLIGIVFGMQRLMRSARERNQAEESLKKALDEIEKQVEERTSALAVANKELRVEITERKQAEEALRLSEEKFRSFVEQSSEGVYLFELAEPIPITMPVDAQIKEIYKGYITECNDIMARMYGYTSVDELKGVSLSVLHGGVDKPENIEFIRSWILSNYRIVNAESSEVDSKGNYVWFSNNVIGIVENGYLTRAWGTQTDITQRKQAEEELKKYREHLEELVKERTRELEEKNKELERMNKLFVGRELRIKELKEQIKSCNKQS